MNILAPSILSSDLSIIGEQLKIIDEAGAQWVHIDVMDGCFVPSISYGMPFIKSIRKCTDRVFDVHLMVEEPIRYIDDFADCGADIITVHVECCKHLDRTIDKIHERGCKAGVALNPTTSLCTIDYILEKVDMVLIMSVNPGYGGQKYIPYTTDKVAEIREVIEDRKLNVDVEIDGGVTFENCQEIAKAGANIIVSGSTIFKGDIAANCKRMLEMIN